MGSGNAEFVNTGAGIFVAAGVGFLLALIQTLNDQPLVPVQPLSLAWNRAWLVATLLDYYCQSLFFCGVVLCTEKKPSGFLWIAGVWLLGSWIPCVYGGLRLLHFGNLELRDEKDPDGSEVQKEETWRPHRVAPQDGKTPMGVYVFGVAGASFLLCLVSTLLAQPLFPPQLDSVDWNRAWLFATLGDYYCLSAIFCGIVLSTEKGPAGLAWCAGLWFAGSWVACIYGALRLRNAQTLALRGLKDQPPGASGTSTRWLLAS